MWNYDESMQKLGARSRIMTQDTISVVPLILKTTSRSFCRMPAPVHAYLANVDFYLQHAQHLNGSVYGSKVSFNL